MSTTTKPRISGTKDCLHCLAHGQILVDWRDHSKGFKTCPQCGGTGYLPESLEEIVDRVNGPNHWLKAEQEAAALEREKTYGRP